MSAFLLILISVIGLLTVASYSSVLAKKLHFPYTILLFLVGVIIVTLAQYIPSFHFISKLELSKDLVFFLFLPTLIFESAFNMPYKKLLRDSVPLFSLSVVSLLVSTFLIGIFFKLGLSLFHIEIPYTISFLFGAIISATDPITVLSIFKEYGVPKRILHLFEGESLFNDGTAVALFFIIFGIIEAGTVINMQSITVGVLSFSSMIIGGIFFGLFMGVLFSKLIERVRDSWAELTLTLILAHTTFILSEIISEQFTIFKISSIIATTIAAMTIGNYGRYKISGNVRKMMHSIWGYFAFISNSLIFLLMGMLIGKIDFHLSSLIIPIVLAISIVVAARAISIFSVLTPLNYFLKHPISFNSQKLLAWGSLRGAIAITMLLFIPENFYIEGWSMDISPKEFLSVVVISCIVFTLMIKATTIKLLIQKMGIANLSLQEQFTLHQIKDLIDKRILQQLLACQEKQYVSDEVTDSLIKKYEIDERYEQEEIKKCYLKKREFENLLRKYALGIERNSILSAFESKEVDEYTLKRILNKIESQFMRIEENLPQLKDKEEKESLLYVYREKIFASRYSNQSIQFYRKQYVFYRSRAIIAEKVVTHITKFKEDFCSNVYYKEVFKKVIQQYQQWYDVANKKMYEIEDSCKKTIHKEEARLLNNHLIYIEEDIIDDLYSKHIMSGKIHSMLKKSLWEEGDPHKK
jgi:monovalent cation:H+ antiporter, CPA1 family